MSEISTKSVKRISINSAPSLELNRATALALGIKVTLSHGILLIKGASNKEYLGKYWVPTLSLNQCSEMLVEKDGARPMAITPVAEGKGWIYMASGGSSVYGDSLTHTKGSYEASGRTIQEAVCRAFLLKELCRLREAGLAEIDEFGSPHILLPEKNVKVKKAKQKLIATPAINTNINQETNHATMQ